MLSVQWTGLWWMRDLRGSYRSYGKKKRRRKPGEEWEEGAVAWREWGEGRLRIGDPGWVVPVASYSSRPMLLERSGGCHFRCRGWPTELLAVLGATVADGNILPGGFWRRRFCCRVGRRE